MRSEQIIQAIEYTLGRPAIVPYARQTVEVASGVLDLVYGVLRRTNPCPSCHGSGRDERKPFDAAHILSAQQCDACDGRGFAVEDGDDAIYAWVVAHDAARAEAIYPVQMSGHDVRALRDDLGISQRELAERINQIDPSMRVSPTTVSRWETGQRTPSRHASAAMRAVARIACHG